jgi:hypothetical protein
MFSRPNGRYNLIFPLFCMLMPWLPLAEYRPKKKRLEADMDGRSFHELRTLQLFAPTEQTCRLDRVKQKKHSKNRQRDTSDKCASTTKEEGRRSSFDADRYRPPYGPNRTGDQTAGPKNSNGDSNSKEKICRDEGSEKQCTSNFLQVFTGHGSTPKPFSASIASNCPQSQHG